MTASHRKPGALTEHLVDFCRFLRTKGFKLGTHEETEALQVLGAITITDWDQFLLLLRSLLAKTYAQHLSFDDFFEEFWTDLFKSFGAKTKSAKDKNQPQRKTSSLPELKNWLYRQQTELSRETSFYSSGKAQQPELPEYEARQVADLVKVLKRFTRDWANRHSRRYVVSSKTSNTLDIRKTLQKNLRREEILQLYHKKPKLQKLDLVILCDVSRSMEMFGTFTVQLLYAFQNNYRALETFVFGSELYRISPWLKQHSFKKSLAKLRHQVPDWSGGTRIGYALDQFIQNYGAQMLHKRTLVLVISDGWDTGETALLQWAMAYIQRRVKKLIWLNPHAGKADYEPKVSGMMAALPFVDIFQGVHDLESLKKWQQQGYRSL